MFVLTFKVKKMKKIILSLITVLSLATVAVAQGENGGFELVQFSASKTEKAVILNWDTKVEKNTSHFELQKSSNIDFSNATQVAMIYTNEGITTTKMPYKAKDVLSTSTTYYRLVMVDKDGNKTISRTISVQ
jgi:proteasome assembly chaperone (PAC2) family protein